MTFLLPGILAMAAIVLASNILVQFLFGQWLTWGAFTYPLAFLVTDLVNFVHGPKAARKVVLLGWSLGGIYARVLAQRHPDLVDLVVTLGTPFSGDRRANNAWRVYEALNDHAVDASPLPDDPSVKPSVPTIAAGLFMAKYTPGSITEAATIAMMATNDSISMPP